MFTQAVLPDTLRAIKLAATIPDVQKAYLAGGTSLALQIGHRISVDLDFFTKEKFREEAVELALMHSGFYKKDGISWQTVWGKLGETKFSMFYYEYPLIEPTIPFEGLQLAGKKDITAMKIHAIEDRGTRRDFIDTYILAQEFTLQEMLEFYQQKFTCLDEHIYTIVRALQYFEDAEAESAMPNMLIDIKWEDVKQFFLKESKKIVL